MSDLLRITTSHPLEREFEAWIADAVENYFESVGVGATVWSVSPTDEKTWPADLGVRLPAKLVGLQVKRPTVSKSTNAASRVTYDRIQWSLVSPSGQRSLIASAPEIYYCFPCFLNRKHRRHVLAHCLFWRPNGAVPSQVWYENGNAHTAPSIADAPRWGRFVEQVVSCRIGQLVVNTDMVSTYFRELRQKLTSQESEQTAASTSDDVGSSFATTFMALEV